jgi:Zyg-11 family protein
MNKYKEIVELYGSMTSIVPSERPNCEEILERKHMWALNGNEFKLEDELKNFINCEVNNENYYIYSILESNLREYFRKESSELSASEQDSNLNKQLFENIQALNVTESSNLYEENPVLYLKTLYDLIFISRKKFEPTSDFIDSIVTPLKKHSNKFLILLVATEYLLKSTENRFAEKIDSEILENVVQFTIKGMELFPNHRKLHKNSLSILCNDRILQDVKFDRNRCLRLVVDSMISLRDKDMELKALNICSELSYNISTDEKSNLSSNPDLMEILLETVRSRCQYSEYGDKTLDYALMTISNLTDSSPKTCELFVEKGGLDLYLLILIVSMNLYKKIFLLYHQNYSEAKF